MIKLATMKYSNVFFLLLLIAVFFSACMSGGGETVVRKAASAPVIDGKADAVWNGGDWLPVKHIRLTRRNAVYPEDISASFKVMWDTANCYFLFDVKDDVKFFSNDTGAIEKKFDLKMRDLDGVELFFDPKNQKDAKVDTLSFNYKKFTYGSDSVCTSASTRVNRVVEGIEYFILDTEKGYMLEVKLPWKALGVKPENNMKLGFETNVVDNDNRIPYPDMLPKKESALAWHDHTRQNPFNMTDIYGTLILKDK